MAPTPSLVYPSPVTPTDRRIEQFTSAAPFTIDKRATALAIMLTNSGYIADQVMPPVSVDGELFTWRQGRGEDFRRDDTLVGRTGQANRSEVGEDMIEAKTMDYAWEVPVPQKDIDNAKNSQTRNPIDRATTQATNKIELDRELRVRDLVTGTANYNAASGSGLNLRGQVDMTAETTLATTRKWGTNNAGVYGTVSDPIRLINGVISNMLLRPNAIVMAWDKWITLSMHPVLVKAFNGSDAGTSGMVSKEFFQGLFGLELFTGEAWIDTASIDLPQNVNMANMNRIWGNDAAILRIDPKATSDTSSGTWGFTGKWGIRRVYRYTDPRMGVDGGQIVKVGEHCREIVSSKLCGFLLKDVFGTIA